MEEKRSLLKGVPMSDEKMNLQGRFAVYCTVAVKSTVEVRFKDNDVWLTQRQLVALFNTHQNGLGR